MEFGINNKNKISLTDYDYEDDIRIRKELSICSHLEIDFFNELVLGPVQTTLTQLSEDLDLGREELLPLLKKKSQVGLYTYTDETIWVDKSQRRLFELELERFDEGFIPNLSFIKSIFTKLPIEVLPKWFLLPRTTNDIFQSLVDKYLITPKVYERYQQELEFEDPLFHTILTTLFTSKTLSISLTQLQAITGLSLDELLKYIIVLEWNFLACMAVEQDGDHYQLMLTPIHEWKEVLLKKHHFFPTPIPEEEIEESTELKEYLSEMANTINKVDQLEKKEKSAFELKHLQLVKRMIQLDLFHTLEKQVLVSEMGYEFLNSDSETRSRYFLRHPKQEWQREKIASDWVLRQIEKSLVGLKGWVYLEEFIEALDVPLEGQDPIQLITRGRHSCYSFPQYGVQDKKEIKELFLGRLAKGGVIRMGKHRGKWCFSLTPFGKKFIQ